MNKIQNPKSKIQSRKRAPRPATRPRVALVMDWIDAVGGSEKVVLELHKLFPQAPIYTTLFSPKARREFAGADVRTSFLQNLPGAARHHQLYTLLMPPVISRIDLSGYDLVISSSHTIAHGVKIGPKTVHICYCHTPVRWAWVPEIDNLNDRLPLGPLARFIEIYFRRWSKKKAKNVTRFVANSRYIRKRLKNTFGREAAVINPPVNVSRIPLVEEREDYYLMAGRLVGYKKPQIIIEAFNRLGLPLRVVGAGPMEKELKALAGPNIKFMGYVGDKELYSLYGRAKAFVFAALEDFGMAPVEAMAAGTPVIGLGDGGLLETVIDGQTGILFPRQSSASIIAAVRRFGRVKFNPIAIRRHATQFDTRVFRRKIKLLIRHALLRRTGLVSRPEKCYNEEDET